jgi:pimeloyl-ACP methyl ester carboxylesterase
VARVLVVPGAAVRSYVCPAVEELQRRDLDAELLAAPGEPGQPARLDEYGRVLAGRIAAEDPVDLLIGLSVGAQVAAVAAGVASTASLRRPGSATPLPVTVPAPPIRNLMLVSPTVDPEARTTPALVTRWLAGGRRERAGLLREQLPDWRRAGPRRIAAVVRSALEVEVEQLLPAVSVPVTVVHAERDIITSHAYAARLAADHGARFVVVPGASHSWPYRDESRFADLAEAVLG